MRKALWLRALLAVGLTGMLLAALLPLAPDRTPAAAAGGVTGWRTDGTRILDPSGAAFIISGINWYGFETRGAVAHGLWTKDYKLIVDQIKQYGYNTIRLPFSNEMWEKNPAPKPNSISACPECKGKRARDIMALIVNYAGAIGLHVILDNHRSTAGNSAQENGLWYTSDYPEQRWVDHWVSIQEWTHGINQTLGAADTVTVDYRAVDGFPVVLGFDLRNEPHTPSRTAYLNGATWGTGDGIEPGVDPNPDAFTPACVASSTCHDWRLAAQRAGNTILTAAAQKEDWAYPLIFVGGIGTYPTAEGTAASGPYDWTWWGGNLLGVNGNANNPGAPVVFNLLRTGAGIDKPLNDRRIDTTNPVYNQLVYSAHDYGPALYKQGWFNSSTCYESGCSPSSLADVWRKFWAHLNLAGGVNPVGPGGSYPWGNTGHTAYSQAPMFLGEFGTGKTDGDLYSSGNGSQGQWFTALINFVQSSYGRTGANDPGYQLTSLHWTYWALNEEDSYGLLGSNYVGLANEKKEYSFLCFIQWGPLALPGGSGSGLCGSTGALPAARTGGGSPNTAPTANNVSMTTNEDTAVATSLSGSDAETCELNFSIVTEPTHGILSAITNNACSGTGPYTDSASVTYTPNANFNGSDSFTYRVNDGALDSNTATVSITVTEQATAMHVGDLDGSTANGSGPTWEAVVDVYAHDAKHNPVQFAIVTGNWSSSKGYSRSGSCTTANTGKCTIKTTDDVPKSHASVTFTVTGVEDSDDGDGTLTYDPSGNHDPDGDSDGTSITISK